jgi:hypothetical protein
MLKKFKYLIIVPAVALVAAGCGESSTSTVKKDVEKTEQNQKAKEAAVGFPNVKNFAESQNLKRYYEEVDDPKRTGYIYLLNYGKIYAEYTVQGKVSSLNSSFTAPERFYDCGTG